MDNFAQRDHSVIRVFMWWAGRFVAALYDQTTTIKITGAAVHGQSTIRAMNNSQG